VSANNQWKAQVRSFDGVDMVLVPAGCFQMGSSGEVDERPVTRICFEVAFWLDRTEVTQSQFRRLGGQAVSKPAFAGDNRPVEQITWFEARDFCAKRGARLPTEAEWEYAARGPDNLMYPWGNSFDGGKVVYNRTSSQGTADVGSKPAGASWVGALDLSGNVYEWVSSLYKPYPYAASDGREGNSGTSSARVLRGGAWVNADSSLLGGAYRHSDFPGFGYRISGFRCARSS
jgi:iron(II)-dependent oxidoreductase